MTLKTMARFNTDDKMFLVILVQKIKTRVMESV
jgi:hypothetical protein